MSGSRGRAGARADAGRRRPAVPTDAQRLERLLATVSHDLRSPLATVLLNSSALLESRRDWRGAEEERRQLEWIVRSAEEMNRMIEDVVEASAMEVGPVRMAMDVCDVGRIVGEEVERCAPFAEAARVRLRPSIATDLPRVRADGRRIGRVLAILLSNAIRFSRPERSIEVVAGAVDGGVEIEVRDEGIGIPPDELPHIFDWYWRGSHGHRGGAGIGLAIARGIVEAHGARLRVESRSGEGSAFAFTLPAVAGAA